MGACRVGTRLEPIEVPCLRRNVKTLRRARDDRFWDGLRALENDVIPDALQHSYGAALIRDVMGRLPRWTTA